MHWPNTLAFIGCASTCSNIQSLCIRSAVVPFFSSFYQYIQILNVGLLLRYNVYATYYRSTESGEGMSLPEFLWVVWNLAKVKWERFSYCWCSTSQLINYNTLYSVVWSVFNTVSVFISHGPPRYLTGYGKLSGLGESALPLSAHQDEDAQVRC